MFEHLKELISGGKLTDEQSADLVKKKLARRSGSAEKRVLDIDSKSDTRSSLTSALDHWINMKSTNGSFYELEPHLVHSLRHSEAVLVPGSTETFNLTRPHPLDELEARRARTADAFSAARFFRKKLKRESA